jgi:hypothetical protein
MKISPCHLAISGFAADAFIFVGCVIALVVLVILYKFLATKE